MSASVRQDGLEKGSMGVDSDQYISSCNRMEIKVMDVSISIIREVTVDC